MVRLSDEEKRQLEQYRAAEYSEDKPLGAVISSLLFEEQAAEQKHILITGKGSTEQYPNSDSSGRAQIVSKPIVSDGRTLRGYSADLVILLTDIPENIREEVIAPMCAEVIELY